MAEERGDTDAAITQALAAMKRRGSNVLLVGTSSSHAHHGACRRLLGEETPTPRKRLFVFTDRDARVDERLPDADPSSAQVVDCANLTRSAAAVTGTTTVGRTRSASLSDLPDLGDEVEAAIDDLGDGLESAQLRVCVDSLRPMLEEHEERDVFRFLHAMTGDVRRVDGMGHYHFPVAYDDHRVRLLEPLFDAVVELRATAGGVQQRWHLRDPEVDSDWLDL